MTFLRCKVQIVQKPDIFSTILFDMLTRLGSETTYFINFCGGFMDLEVYLQLEISRLDENRDIVFITIERLVQDWFDSGGRKVVLIGLFVN